MGTETMNITFDDSLPVFIEALAAAGINASADGGVVVRDSRGRLSFVAAEDVSPERVDEVSRWIDDDLQPYISPLGPIADQNAPGAKRALGDTQYLTLSIPLGASIIPIRLLDRRAVGADWLHAPRSAVTTPPRLVFASLKGGVGRSTALSVLAAELAERGRALLVVDLDMEAPGIGSMLIDADATPRFGSIDFFVESALQDLDDSFILDSIGASWLGGGRGRIDVMPSLGARSLNNPSEVLAKLARAYLEVPSRDDQKTFLERTQELVARLTTLSRYDAVLVDARAGLHETTAAAILGLGADILLFGADQRQTQIGFDILLSHLAQFGILNGQDDWRYKLRLIQAKAEPDDAALIRYRSQMFDLFDRIFYAHETESNGDLLDAAFSFGIDDIDAPHFPIPIFEDERYRLFDPVRDRTQLARELYQQSFGRFIDFCVERLQLSEDS
jgi:cellulose biosynthesis protein BcsQ